MCENDRKIPPQVTIHLWLLFQFGMKTSLRCISRHYREYAQIELTDMNAKFCAILSAITKCVGIRTSKKRLKSFSHCCFIIYSREEMAQGRARKWIVCLYFNITRALIQFYTLEWVYVLSFIILFWFNAIA